MLKISTSSLGLNPFNMPKLFVFQGCAHLYMNMTGTCFYNCTFIVDAKSEAEARKKLIESAMSTNRQNDLLEITADVSPDFRMVCNNTTFCRCKIGYPTPNAVRWTLSNFATFANTTTVQVADLEKLATIVYCDRRLEDGHIFW